MSGRSARTHRIRHYYGCYDALQYPLLFPYGKNGWHPGIPRLPRATGQASGRSTPANRSRPIPLAPVHTTSTEEDLITAEETCKFLKVLQLLVTYVTLQSKLYTEYVFHGNKMMVMIQHMVYLGVFHMQSNSHACHLWHTV